MKIHCYFINWNEKFYIPFFHNHYKNFCEKIIMYDQYSDDGSRELAESLGIEVRNFGRPGVLNDQWYLDVKNNCWKECRCKGVDYVIVVDADEFLSIRDAQLLSESGLTPFPTVTGYNMISDLLPVNDIWEINTGYLDEQYAKQAIFNPNYVTEINYVHGCHKHNAVTNGPFTMQSNNGIELYHFRQIGGVQRMIDRHSLYRNRMSDFNKKHNMGFHYLHSENAKRDEWNFNMNKAKILF